MLINLDESEPLSPTQSYKVSERYFTTLLASPTAGAQLCLYSRQETNYFTALAQSNTIKPSHF